MAKEKLKGEHVSEPQAHSFTGLRDILFDELNLLRANKVSVGRARVTSQLARRIIETVTLDLYAQQKLAGGDSEKDIKRLVEVASGQEF